MSKRIAAHLIVAGVWAALAIPAYLWWQQSILFVIAASVFANVYAAISAVEAAVDRAVLRELRTLLAEQRAVRRKVTAGDGAPPLQPDPGLIERKRL